MSINSWTWHNKYSGKVAKVKGSLAIYTVVQVPSESNNTLLLLYNYLYKSVSAVQRNKQMAVECVWDQGVCYMIQTILFGLLSFMIFHTLIKLVL